MRYNRRAMPLVRVIVGASALMLVLTGAGLNVSTAAAKEYKVRITSAPDGATIRIDDPDSEPLGETPYDGTLPAGPYMVIITLDGHQELIEEIVVKKKRKRQTFAFELEEVPEGRLVVRAADDGAGNGGILQIDGEVAGKLPASIAVSEGAHELVVELDGYERFEQWVEVSAGKAQIIRIAMQPAEEVLDDLGESEEGTGDRGDVPYITAGVEYQMAWRRWRFNGANLQNARPFAASFISLLGVSLEVAPLARSRTVALRGIALWGRARLGLPPDAGVDDLTKPDPPVLSTSWTELEIGAGYAAVLSSSVDVRGEISYGATSVGFEGDAMLVAESPGVAYRFVRPGIEVGFSSGHLRTSIGASYLAGLSTGGIADQFSDSALSGTAAHLGIDGDLGNGLGFRLVGSLRRFVIDLVSDAAAAIRADGATDLYFGASVSMIYRY